MAPDGIYANTKGLRKLADDLYATANGLGIDVPVTTRREAKKIADSARQIALSYPASRPPEGGAKAVAESVRVVRVRPNEYHVEAGGPETPLAGLWELGNKDSDPNASSFRHPAWGRKDWYSQQKWPFLRMALDRNEPIVIGIFERLLDRIFRMHRL